MLGGLLGKVKRVVQRPCDVPMQKPARAPFYYNKCIFPALSSSFPISLADSAWRRSRSEVRSLATWVQVRLSPVGVPQVQGQFQPLNLFPSRTTREERGAGQLSSTTLQDAAGGSDGADA